MITHTSSAGRRPLIPARGSAPLAGVALGVYDGYLDADHDASAGRANVLGLITAFATTLLGYLSLWRVS
ncbi:hypothetical protein [Streptomyces sp. NPDC020681]|uniref:hypothetical protein n=1 Tax=Streptomyces sp. NPDC020681 TaxID=3365083 RepID=UPI0037B05C09